MAEPGGMGTGKTSLPRPNCTDPCAALPRQPCRARLAQILRRRPAPSFSKVPFRAGTWFSICHFRECRVDIVVVRRCPPFVRTALRCRSSDAIPRGGASPVCATKISHSARAKECPKLQKSRLIAGRLHLPKAMAAAARRPASQDSATAHEKRRPKFSRPSRREGGGRRAQESPSWNCHALETPAVRLISRVARPLASGIGMPDPRRCGSGARRSVGVQSPPSILAWIPLPAVTKFPAPR